jgi:hypothetical protein
MLHTEVRVRLLTLSSVSCALFLACMVLPAPFCTAQSKQEVQPKPGEDFAKLTNKYPGLLPEFGTLIDKLQKGVQFPAERNQSSVLPMLSPSTSYYGAFPNYGEAAHQALTIFQQELQQSAVLRSWWRDTLGAGGPEIETSVQKFYELSQYLGDEIVISGESGSKDHSFLLVAGIRKPGLKSFLQQMARELPTTSTPKLRILDPQELASETRLEHNGELDVLVRPDFFVAAPNLDAVRDFNQLLDMRSTNLSSTAFGQRLAQAYQGGASVLLAADLQKILGAVPRTGQSEQMFERGGFDNVKYLVWEHKDVGGHAAGQMELSFTGPRHGIAAWLANPAPLGSLDFVSPKAISAFTLVLKNFGQIFEEVRELSSESNPNSFAMLDQMQAMLNINLKNDLLNYLDGEITFELDGLKETEPLWRAILRVNHPERLRQTLTKLIGATQPGASESTEDGVTYKSVVIPSQQKPTQLIYAIVDGYLVAGSSRESAAEAVRLHRSGESLAKSPRFLAALPAGHSAEASALFYEDPIAITAAQMRQAAPEFTDVFSRIQTSPMLVAAYGDNDAIRAASSGGGADVSGVLIMAAIAIPNLLRAKMSANDAAAVGTVRSINTAQVTYAATYPQRGFARDLATLGSDPQSSAVSPQHAALLNGDIGNSSCTAGAWCTKSGYRFSVTAQCKQRKCNDFVATATPVTSNTGTKNLCSTSDGVIHSQAGPQLVSPITAAQCRQWAPLQ